MSKSWEIELPDISVDKKGYLIGDKQYVRVTRVGGIIAKNGLVGWYMKVGKKRANSIMKNRQQLGSTVHSLIEKTILGKKVSVTQYNQEIQMDLRLAKNFIENCVVDYDATEQRLWCDEFAYAGTADFIGTYNSNPEWLVHENHEEPKVRFKKDSFCILDWKTSRDIYDDYWLQMSAYAYAFYERTGIKVDGATIVQFRDGKIRIKERTWKELMEYFEIYKAALKIYKWKHKID